MEAISNDLGDLKNKFILVRVRNKYEQSIEDPIINQADITARPQQFVEAVDRGNKIHGGWS